MHGWGSRLFKVCLLHGSFQLPVIYVQPHKLYTHVQVAQGGLYTNQNRVKQVFQSAIEVNACIIRGRYTVTRQRCTNLSNKHCIRLLCPPKNDTKQIHFLSLHDHSAARWVSTWKNTACEVGRSEAVWSLRLGKPCSFRQWDNDNCQSQVLWWTTAPCGV